MRVFYTIILGLTFLMPVQSQESYSVGKIDEDLLKNANAVVRKFNQETVIKSLDKVTIHTYRVVTVLNSEGASHINAYEYYSEGDKVKDQEALILDANGKEIKKIKRKDFRDISAYGSSTLFSDSRVSHLDYTPRSYPYTVVYTSEFEKENSVFLRSWVPLETYNVSIENAEFDLENPKNFPMRYKENNFEGYEISKNVENSKFSYGIKNVPARKTEILSPSLSEIVPMVLFSLDVFELEGVKGETKDWKHFGKWMYDNLVEGRDQLSTETIHMISNLTKDAKTTEEKARIIYEYVQDNTRYISVQYGLGGWEPASAESVDELGYGDCKALTNYTKALLKSQGIDSYYTVVYGGSKKDIDPDFTRMQGNHVILNIPQQDSTDIWLECTSQKTPFNYLGDFTDDRHVLRISNEGGEIIKTKKYEVEENLQEMTCTIQLNENGGFNAELLRSTFGVPYGDKYQLIDENEADLKNYYRHNWSQLQNLSFEDIQLENDRDAIEFREKIRFSGDRLGANAGNRLLLPLNFIQQESISIPSTNKRTMPLHIERGKTYKDHFIFELPEGFEIEALPESENIASDFGEFSISISALENSSIEIQRLLVINEGEWPKERFSDFQEFVNTVSRLNHLKAVIVNNSKS